MFADEMEFDGEHFLKLNVNKENLSTKEFYDCMFERCTFTEVDFSNAIFDSCTFNNCTFSMSKICGCKFREVLFKECRLLGMDFSSCDTFVMEFSFDKSHIQYSNFSRLDMPNTLFADCNIFQCDFIESSLEGADFRNSKFDDTVFEDCTLKEADFRGAANYEININKNKVKNAKFSVPEAVSLLKFFDIKLYN